MLKRAPNASHTTDLSPIGEALESMTLALDGNEPDRPQLSVSVIKRTNEHEEKYIDWSEDERVMEVDVTNFNPKGTLTQPDLNVTLTCHIEEQAFKSTHLGFPTERRPIQSQRPLSDASESEINAWIERSPKMIGNLADTEGKQAAVKQLLYTWRELFVDLICHIPATDLITHQKPTYPHMRAKFSLPPMYTPKERAYQREVLPALLDAGVITTVVSPWSARTKFPLKKNAEDKPHIKDQLRMVHNFIPINAATIKEHYPIKRIEPIINDIAQRRISHLFKSDAANGYWAILLALEDSYKTAFASDLGQLCYRRMGQGLLGAPATYSHLKDLVFGPIPSPHKEPALNQVMEGEVVCCHFMDDDVGGASSFGQLMQFLHDFYFPRVAFARLTLSPHKSHFFMEELSILGMSRGPGGIRPSADKVAVIREWPYPELVQELERFLYQLPFMRRSIPGRADLHTIMMTAVKSSFETVEGLTTKTGWPKKQKKVTGFQFDEACREAFDAAKRAIVENCTSGGDPHLQYHLATDASDTGIGGYLFQLPNEPPGTNGIEIPPEQHSVVMFISFKLSETEKRYTTTEREALAVLKCCEESRWLIQGNKHPTKLYTNHIALLAILQGGDAGHGRITRWQQRLSEYWFDIHHVPGRKLVVADGLSRIPGIVSFGCLIEEPTFEAFAAELEEMQARSTGTDHAISETLRRWEK